MKSQMSSVLRVKIVSVGRVRESLSARPGPEDTCGSCTVQPHSLIVSL